jgi:hypothetical protein
VAKNNGSNTILQRGERNKTGVLWVKMGVEITGKIAF